MNKEQQQTRIEGQYRTYEDFRAHFYSRVQSKEEQSVFSACYGRTLAKTILETKSSEKLQDQRSSG